MKWVYTICEKIGGTANIRIVKDVGETYKMVLDLTEVYCRKKIRTSFFPMLTAICCRSPTLSDTAITRNFAYIYGHGEGAECKNTTYCVSDEPAYLERYELYVDAKDISEEEQVEGETVPIPKEQYIALLKTRGSEKLVDPKTASESEIAANSTQYVYNRDYYVGDYVTVEHKRFGMIQPKVQLIGMIEAFDQNGRSLTPTFKE